MAETVSIQARQHFAEVCSSVNEEMTKVMTVAMLMNHFLPQLYVSQFSKFETISVNATDEDHFSIEKKEPANLCIDCRYFDNSQLFTSSFSRFEQYQLNCPTCNRNIDTQDCPNLQFGPSFELYHTPMVLPTSNNNDSNNIASQRFIREYLLNSLFQSVNNPNIEANNQQQVQNYFLYNEGSKPKNIAFPDKNRNNQNEKKVSPSFNQTMALHPKTEPINQNSFFYQSSDENEEDAKSRLSTSSSCLSNVSTFSNQSFTNAKKECRQERSWKVSYESEEYKGLLRNTSFKIKTRTDNIEDNISSQLYSSLKYQFNISSFINKSKATELAINQKSYGGIIIATVESLVVRNEDENSEEDNKITKEEICLDVLKGELELALQPIESIEATESKAFKPFLQQLRREISKEDNDYDENEWLCLLNKTKMQFSDQSLHNKKNSYEIRVSFYLNKEFKERKPIIIFQSAPFKIYARRSKRMEESEGGSKRKRKTKAKTNTKKQKNETDASLLSKFESEVNILVQFIGNMTNSIEKKLALQSFMTSLAGLDNQTANNMTNNLMDTKQPIDFTKSMYIDTSFVRQPTTTAKLLNESSEMTTTCPCYGHYHYGDLLTPIRDDHLLESSISKDMLLSIGQSSVLDSPHTPDFSVKGSESKLLTIQNQPPKILQLLNQPNRIDLSKIKNIGSINPSMLNKYLQDDVQTPTIMNTSNNLIGLENSLDIFDVSPLPIQGNSNTLSNEPNNTFDQLIFDLQQLHQTKKN